MKTKILFLTTILATQIAFADEIATTSVKVETRRAVEISVGGTGYAMDRASYKRVRKAIGEAVTNDVIDKFVIYGYGKEGGFSGCVEARHLGESPTKAFEKFVKQLNAIRVPKKTTFYSVNRLETCPPLTPQVSKPKTVFVAKSDQSRQCDTASGVSLSEMEKELTGVNVYSAEKKADGLMHITLCGAETGMFNVYEIAETDAQKAKDFGFVEWTEK